MRRSKLTLAVLAMALVAAACGGGGEGDADDAAAPAPTSATPTTAAATTAPPPSTAVPSGPATNLTLRIANVRLANSEESDNAMRIILPAGVATASVTLTGVPSPNRVISVCQTQELGRRMPAAACRAPAGGEAVTVTLGSAARGVEIVQVGVTGTGPGGNTATLEEVSIRYTAASREVSAHMPQIAGAEVGPTFSLTPPSTDGSYRAQMNWMVIQAFGGTQSNGQLELVQGANATNQAQSGALEVRLTGTVSPPGEAAIRMRNGGRRPW